MFTLGNACTSCVPQCHEKSTKSALKEFITERYEEDPSERGEAPQLGLINLVSKPPCPLAATMLSSRPESSKCRGRCERLKRVVREGLAR